MVRKKNESKKLTVILIGFLIFLAGFLTRGLIINNKPVSTIQTISPTYKQKNIVLPDPKEGKYKVIDVIDGDTVKLETGEKFRFLGIDAPEQNDAWGLSAKDFLSDLILNKYVRIEFDREKLDRYSRVLGYLWLDKILINEKILEEGFAVVSLEQHGYKLIYIDRLRKAEQWAKDHHNGIWFDEWTK